MKKFVFVYYGGTTPENLSKEEIEEAMGQWGAWFESIGENIVDGGAPFAGNGMSVSPEGVDEIAPEMWPSTGYTIVSAESMEAATEVAKGCPSVVNQEKGAAVRVYEVVPM